MDKEIKKEEHTGKKSEKKKQNRQLIIAVVLMVSFLVITLVVPFVIKNYINKFSYINLDFTKTKYKNVVFYNTVVPLVDNKGQIVKDYGIDFRSDPRKLEYIKVNIDENELKVSRNNKTYISLPSEFQKCEDNVIAIANLARFLGGFAQLTLEGASTNQSYAKEFNQTYATCETNPNNTVIIVKSGNETRIDKTNKNCYELTYANCEIIPVTERFSLTILERYMQLFERKK